MRCIIDTNKKAKLQRTIQLTNRTMIKIFETENGISDFKTWLCAKNNPKRLLIALLGMTEEEFISEALKTNITYQFPYLVDPITTFMRTKAIIYEAYLNTLDKESFYWHLKN